MNVFDKLISAIKKKEELGDKYGIFALSINEHGGRKYYVKKYEDLADEYEIQYKNNDEKDVMLTYDEVLLNNGPISFIVDIDLGFDTMYVKIDEKEFIDACIIYIKAVEECAKLLFNIDKSNMRAKIYWRISTYKHSVHIGNKGLVFDNMTDLRNFVLFVDYKRFLLENIDKRLLKWSVVNGIKEIKSAVDYAIYDVPHCLRLIFTKKSSVSYVNM